MIADSKISYVELPGTDLAATKTFYQSAFGWRFTDYGPTYSSFGPDEAGIDGGFDADPEGVKAPLVVLFAQDLEAMFAKVVEAGGVISRPIFSFPGGRRFHFRDPSGNELAVFTEEA